jgi:hypothetical protein
VLKSTQSQLAIMTLSRTGTEYLTDEEWNELNALREAINYDPHTVSPEKMEKFTELMVRSLEGKGDPVSMQTKPTNY